MIAWDVLNYQTLSVIFCSACPQRGGERGEEGVGRGGEGEGRGWGGEGEGRGDGGGGRETKRTLHGPDSLSNSKHVGHSVQNSTFFYKNMEVRKERKRTKATEHSFTSLLPYKTSL
jgi:hypothetical protein